MPGYAIGDASDAVLPLPALLDCGVASGAAEPASMRRAGDGSMPCFSSVVCYNQRHDGIKSDDAKINKD
jgi:hypothetical protein